MTLSLSVLAGTLSNVYDEALRQLRRICLALPEVTERLSHGSPAFFVREKKTLLMLLDDHHGDGRLAIWCPAPEGVQATLVDAEPHRFFRPPYVGVHGWLGVRLDVEVDWNEIAGIVEDAYRIVAPKTLVRQLATGRQDTSGQDTSGQGT